MKKIILIIVVLLIVLSLSSVSFAATSFEQLKQRYAFWVTDDEIYFYGSDKPFNVSTSLENPDVVYIKPTTDNPVDFWKNGLFKETKYSGSFAIVGWTTASVPIYLPDGTLYYEPPKEIHGLFADGSILGSIGDIELSWKNWLFGDFKIKLNKIEAGAKTELKAWKSSDSTGTIYIPKSEIPIISNGYYQYQIYEGDRIIEEYNFEYNNTYNETIVNQSDVDKTPLDEEMPERIHSYLTGSTPYQPMLLSLEKLKTFNTADYRTLCPELHINLGDLLDAASSHIAPDLVGKLNIDVIYFDLSILNQIEFLGVPVIQYMRSLLSMCMIFYTALHIYHSFIPDKVIVGG